MGGWTVGFAVGEPAFGRAAERRGGGRERRGGRGDQREGEEDEDPGTHHHDAVQRLEVRRAVLCLFNKHATLCGSANTAGPYTARSSSCPSSTRTRSPARSPRALRTPCAASPDPALRQFLPLAPLGNTRRIILVRSSSSQLFGDIPPNSGSPQACRR